MIFQDPSAPGPIPIVPMPTGYSPAEIAVWLVLLFFLLIGAGGATTIYLRKIGYFNQRERKLWERIEGQLKDQEETTKEQEEKIERLKHKAEGYYEQVDALHKKNFEDRVAWQATVIELNRGLFEEKEAGAQNRALFAHLSQKFEDCQEANEEKVRHMGDLRGKVVECEQRDAARAAKLVEVEHALDELRQRMPGAR